MPTKHINKKTWASVRDLTVKAIVETREHFNESEVLSLLIEKGLEHKNEIDFFEIANQKNGRTY